MGSLVVLCEWMEVRGGDIPGKLPPGAGCCLTCGATRPVWGGAVPPLLAQLLSWGWRIQGDMGNWVWQIWAPAKGSASRSKLGLTSGTEGWLAGREETEGWKSMWILLSSPGTWGLDLPQMNDS